MSFYIALERKIPGFDELFVDGTFLARASDELDDVAKKLAVTPLMEFFSASLDDLTAVIGEDECEGIEPRDAKWFAASEGLKTIEALINHLQADTKAVPRPDHVLQDLRDFETILKRADAEGVRWHLAMDV